MCKAIMHTRYRAVGASVQNTYSLLRGQVRSATQFCMEIEQLYFVLQFARQDKYSPYT